MNVERRTDTLLAGVVETGFDLNFTRGFRDAGAFLRSHHVSAKVIVRIINYGPRRAAADMASPEERLVPVAPLMNYMPLPGIGPTIRSDHAGLNDSNPMPDVAICSLEKLNIIDSDMRKVDSDAACRFSMP